MDAKHVIAHYRIETAVDPEAAAEVLAGEQSSGTFVAVPGETAALRANHRAQVLKCEVLGQVDQPTLPGAAPTDGPIQRADVSVAYPIVNFGANLSTLVTTLTGNLFELRQFSGLKLLDVELPVWLAKQFAMPKFGVAGTRQLAGVSEGPIIGTIIKPSVGLTPEQTAEQVRELGEAGLDFIKDDELQADGPHCPFGERVKAVMRVVNDLADRTGRKPMVAFNISDRVDRMLRKHDTVVEHGGTCVMVSLHSIGFAAVEQLREHTALPIHGHRNGWGMYTRCPQLGVEYTAWQKLWRLAGVDHLHVNGLRNKFWEPDESVIASIQAVRQPIVRAGDAAMPVVASGQWAGHAPDTYRLAGTADLMHVAGGGIMAHPDGSAAGVASMRQAWEAAINDIPLTEHARTRPELARAIERFGDLHTASR